jgi:hypothetical protein
LDQSGRQSDRLRTGAGGLTVVGDGSPLIASLGGVSSGEAHLRVVLGWQGHLESLKPPLGRRENRIGGWKRELGQKRYIKTEKY